MPADCGKRAGVCHVARLRHRDGLSCLPRMRRLWEWGAALCKLNHGEARVMSKSTPSIEIQAREAIREFLVRRRLGANRSRVYLVSYPRSGNTLVRTYFSILQGRPQ